MKPTSASLMTRLTASRFFAGVVLLLLAGLFFYSLGSLRPAGEINPTFHVASRYMDRSLEETGFTHSFSAIFLDYRGFDLVLLSLFFLSMTLFTLLLCVVEELTVRSREGAWAFLALFSSLSLLLLGWVGLNNGSNFMDYEWGARVFGSAARVHGGWIAGALTVTALLTSFVWTWKVLALGEEKSFDDQ